MRRRMLRALSGARTRILASYVVLLVLSALVSAVAIRAILNARTADRIDEALEQEVGEFRQLVRDGRDPRDGELFGDDVRAIFDVYLSRNVPALEETLATFVDGRLYATVSGASGGRLDFGGRAGQWARLERSERGTLRAADGEAARYVAVPILREGRPRGTFVVLADLSGEREEVDDSVVVVVLVLLSVALAASALAWVVAGRVLAPLRGLTDTARSITESDLTRRIAVRGADELSELARTFNAMLERLETAFASQRQFVNDASHELRTPITIVRGHLELLGDDPDDRRETLALVMDELDRMNRFVDDLLLLARVGRPDFLQTGPVALDALTDELLAKAGALGARDWRLDARASGILIGDRQRLTQALTGLADNAVQHTREGQVIALGSAVRNGDAMLWVRDEGSGIAPADQERIFERFARATHARRRSDGAGLGLAIVRAIAEAHGGRVQLDSAPGKGARFTMVIPMDGPERTAP